MTAEMKILIAWLLFAGTHIGGSSRPVRARLIRAVGLQGFKGIYTLVAFATFIPLCYVYFTNKHAGTALFTPGAGLRLLAQAIMLLAFVVLAQGIATPSPLGSQAEMTGAFPDRARGIQRVTRHPQNL
ncbi:MAG: NnrU family protein, partial [Acidobacteriota bacterium]